MAHLKRGVYGWNMENLPFEGEYDSAGAGRTPSVVEEEIFAYGRKVRPSISRNYHNSVRRKAGAGLKLEWVRHQGTVASAPRHQDIMDLS